MTGVSVRFTMTVEAESGIAICALPEVEMTSERSGLEGSQLVEASLLVFTRNFSDL